MDLAECKVVKSGVVTSVYMPDSAIADFKQRVFLISDVHFDSIYCDRKLLKRDLDRAKRDGEWIICAGDWVDAMQGKRDPRGRLDELRPELKSEKYFDLLVDHAVEFLEPYQESLLLFGYGNHETSVIRHHGTDLLSRMVGALNNGKEHKIQTGGYGGWIRFMFQSGKTSQGRVAYRYHHGKGASAFVSDGIMDDKRAAATIPDADVVHFGHNHKEYVHPVARERLNGKGNIEHSTQLYIRTPGYKAAYIQDAEGLSWEYATMGSPTPLGGVNFTIGNDAKSKPAVISYEKTF